MFRRAFDVIIKENYWDGNRRLSSIAMDDSGVSCDRYTDKRAALEDSDHLAVHCVHIFMQNLYHYATKNTVRRVLAGLLQTIYKR